MQQQNYQSQLQRLANIQFQQQLPKQTLAELQEADDL
jgi:hypothetical protein